MARIKPEPVIVADLTDAGRILGEIGALDREIALIECDMQETIDNAKANAAKMAKPLQDRRKALSDAVGTFATLNRQDLFRKSKSLDLGFGVIGFRLSTSISQLRGVTVEMTIDRMRELKLLEGIRVKESVDKDACGSWPDERLELVGLKRQQKDAFYIEIKADAIPESA